MIFRNTPYEFIFNAPTTGRTWTVYMSKDGGNYGLGNSSVLEGATSNSYRLIASASDMDGNIINFKIVENNDTLFYDEPIEYEITITTDDPLILATANYLNQLPSDILGIQTNIGTIQSNITTIGSDIVDMQSDVTNIQSEVTDILAMRFPGAADGTVVWTYILYTDATFTIPLENCLVKMTEDVDGQVDLKEQYTNSLGETRWLVVPGTTYYMWRQKDNWRFINPDVQTINLVAPYSSIGSYIDQPTPYNAPERREFPGDGDALWSYTVYSDVALSIPLESCWVRMTTDLDNQHIIGEQFTDGSGITKWLIVPGHTYYMWRQKKNYTFTDPDIQTINLVEPYSMQG